MESPMSHPCGSSTLSCVIRAGSFSLLTRAPLRGWSTVCSPARKLMRLLVGSEGLSFQLGATTNKAAMNVLIHAFC